MKLYLVANDLIGGYALSFVNKTVGDHSEFERRFIVADMVGDLVAAERIVDLWNESVHEAA